MIFNTKCHFDKVPLCVYTCNAMPQWTWGSNVSQTMKRKKVSTKNKCYNKKKKKIETTYEQILLFQNGQNLVLLPHHFLGLIDCNF